MTRSTRRAPHMEKYVLIEKIKHNLWRIHLQVGVQRFPLAVESDTKREANWMRDMLCIALDNVVQGEKKDAANRNSK